MRGVRAHTRTQTVKDTDSIYSRDLEVINQLDDGFSVGVRGVAIPHLDTHVKVTALLHVHTHKCKSHSHIGEV